MTSSYYIRRATTDDVDSIYNLTRSNAEQGLMLREASTRSSQPFHRSLLSLKRTARRFLPRVRSPRCGRISVRSAPLPYTPYWQGKGLGKALVKELIIEAERLKIPQVITLTYQVEFFKTLGFRITDKNEFPRKLWRECLECPKLEACDETAMVFTI